MKKHNHIYPAFHIRKWKEHGGKIYVKKTGIIRNINPQKDFTLDFYYSLGQENSNLEDRISRFERYVGNIVKKIDNAENEIYLSAKELELLKLYCVLCVNRQHYTSEVILDDDLGIYKSNNYLFGTHLIKKQIEAVKVTEQIIADFEKIVKLEEISTQIIPQIVDPRITYSVFTIGLHIAILRSDYNDMCIAENCAIIENTLDSDHLYTYIPISPHTAICLVKSKYYLTWQHFENTKERFGNKYGLGQPDPYISEIFNGNENLLFCSYYFVKSNVHLDNTYIPQNTAKFVVIKIDKVDSNIVRQFNAIFCQDGEKILFCEQKALDSALAEEISFRHIKTTF